MMSAVLGLWEVLWMLSALLSRTTLLVQNKNQIIITNLQQSLTIAGNTNDTNGNTKTS